MFLDDTSGRRFTVVLRPGAQVSWPVPPPYTTRGFLSRFTPAQRRRLLGALAADPRLPSADLVLARTSTTDPAVLNALAALLDRRALALVDGVPAQRARATGGGGGEPAPRREPEPAPAPAPVTETVCDLLDAVAACPHGRKASTRGRLEVVPGRGDELIKLSSTLRGGCGKHTRWEVRSPDGMTVKNGVDASFVATMWGFKTLGVFEVVPRHYAVTATACGGVTKSFEVVAYPADEWNVDVGIDFKKPPTSWTLKIVTPYDDTSLKVKSTIMKVLEDRKKQLDWVLDKTLKPLLGKSLDWEFFKTKLNFKGKWMEAKDHRAFYQYEVTLSLDPLIKGTFTVPFGPTAAIPPWIKKWSTDLIGDLYLYLKFEGEVKLSGKWGASSPDEHSASAAGSGKVGVKVGGNLFLMKRSAVNVDVNGGTNITAEVSAPVQRKPAVKLDLKWGGIEVELTIEAAWGMVEFKRKWKPLAGGSLLSQPAVWHPLGEAC